jgi:hypothetical protein
MTVLAKRWAADRAQETGLEVVPGHVVGRKQKPFIAGN